MKRLVRQMPVESFTDTQPTEIVNALHAALQDILNVPVYVERYDVLNWGIFTSVESVEELKWLQLFACGFLAGEEFGRTNEATRHYDD